MSSLSGHDSSMSEISSREMPTSESNEESEIDNFENVEDEVSNYDENDDNIRTARPPDGFGKGSNTIAAADMLEYIDQLIESNTISSERGVRLKRKYNALMESIEMSRTAENTLLLKTRELQLKLSSDQQILDKANGFPESYSTEISHLRQIQLQHDNELKQSKEVGADLDREISRLEEEYKQTKLEYDHMPKKEEIEGKIEELKKEMEGINEDIAERNVETGKLKDAKKLKESRYESIRAEVNQLKSVQSSLQDELATLSLGPVSTPREMDRLRKAISETTKKISENKQTMNEIIEEIQRQTERTDTLTEELSTLKNNYDEERQKIEANQVCNDSLVKNILSGKEHESTQMEEGASLELQKKLKSQEHKQLYESFLAKTKEKDKELKQLKRADIQLRTAFSGIEQQERLLETVTRRSLEANETSKKRNETLNNARHDVEALRKTVAQQVGYENVEQRYLTMHIDKERHYRGLSKKALNTLHDIGRDVIAMTHQRDNRSRDYYKTVRDLHDVQYDEKIKKNLIEDQQKKLRDLDTNLREFAEAYKVVKNERNKAYSQIQTCQQLSAEMKEKMKVLQNELEILQNAVDSKSKVLTRAQLALISKTQDRDTQQQEMSKVRLHQSDTQNDLDRQREILHKLTKQIGTMEQALNKLRLRYEYCVQDRNDTGLQLIERNEEVCVFHEKLNVQDSVCRKGNMQLMEREEEIRILNMEIATLNREVYVSNKLLMESGAIERDLTRCQNQLLSARETIKHLEEKVTDANDPERLRLLKGEDPSCAEVREKIEKLQIRLTDQEQKVLEKELLLEQVSRLDDRLMKKVDTRRHVTLQVGNKVNNYQSKLTDGTRKMMAIVSELSLQQALAIRLQQAVNEKEAQLEQAYSRLECGEAPDEESAKEWNKLLQMNQMAAVNRNMEQSPEDGRELPNGVYTMAESRPNAYIPESEIELPLPKPYGAHAPFKPSQLGANMRHIRKPQPQIIDI